MYIIFDLETTGFILDKNKSTSEVDNFPRVVQIAWQIHDELGNLLENHDYLIKPVGFTIPFAASQVHGISTEKAIQEGHDLVEILHRFNQALDNAQVLVGHNIIEYDVKVIAAEFIRNSIESPIEDRKAFDTMSNPKIVEFCALGGGKTTRYKFPKLGELYHKLFNENFEESHNAAADVNANARAFFEIIRQQIVSFSDVSLSKSDFEQFISTHSTAIQPFAINIRQQVSVAKNISKETETTSNSTQEISSEKSNFFHFHVHTTYSILQSTIKIKDLLSEVVQHEYPAIGITDFGNLMGAFQFINEVNAKNASLSEDKKIIPIVGCEVYVSEHYLQNKFTKDNPDRKYTQVLLAKNFKGFQNLSKISTIGYTKGFYAGNPRVGKEIIVQYKENLIATTGSLWSEIPSLILNHGEEKAEEAFVWWKEQFGDDFYVELIDHSLPEEKHVNEILLQFSKKYDVKTLAQNEPFYIHSKEANSQDILICIKDGEKLSVPKGRGFGHRFGLKNEEYYLKSETQIKEIFRNNPESISNFDAFIQKFEAYTLNRNVLLPTFNIPSEFIAEEDKTDNGHRGENAYLKYLTYEGAKKRYGELTTEIQERLDFELETIENTGYPGYFLIVQDFTSEARKMGVSVGPGRGSAAGSAVAYCIGITNVDPIKYNLLFERFLNPERVSLPDIDIDFDDRGRDKIINWVVEKYGQNQVAQIITYGTLAGRSAIRDAGRVLELPLRETDALSKRLPATINLKTILNSDEKTLKSKVRNDDFANVKYIKDLNKVQTLEAKVVENATLIEGGIRNTGVHACGVIITPEDITNLVPVAVAKDSDLWVSQFDNSVVESAGLLKMDFLGLRTLTIIKDAIEIIKERKGIEINEDEIPLHDELTYEKVFKSGNTVGIFQFESVGMQKNLKLLQPNKFEDLIAMTALYRPGPMEYIPNFINRKHGKEPIAFDLPEMQEYLDETYGITVYQEQVMLLSQKLSGFTKGGADSLRKAMGKKKKEEMDKMYAEFVQGGIKNGHPEEILQKIWKDWEAFAQYAFNKSHATCYSVISFQTAYLKAHYPSEFMASLLTNNLGNLKTLTFFMEECKKMNIKVLAPEINESKYAFFVNEEGNIRFGLGAIKGVGQNAVDCIVNERLENGKYTSIYNFFERVDLRNVNKKVVESLAYSGAFDEMGNIYRSQFFEASEQGTFIEQLLKYGSSSQENENSQQQSLFGELTEGFEIQKPSIPICEKWNILYELSKEKEMVGIYISSHPLDEYKHEIKKLNPVNLADLEANKEQFVDQQFNTIGMIQSVEHKVSNDGRSEFGIFDLEDYSGTMNFRIYGENYLKIKHLIALHHFVCVKVSVKRNIHNPSIIYVNVNGINLLKDVLTSVQHISIALNVNALQQNEVEQLVETIEQNKGEQTLSVDFIESEESLSLRLKSMKYKVQISKNLLDSLQHIESVKYKLN